MYSTSYSGEILVTIDLFDRFSKHTQISNLMKIRLMGVDLFHAG
jgi:hypothetical protein